MLVLSMRHSSQIPARPATPRPAQSSPKIDKLPDGAPYYPCRHPAMKTSVHLILGAVLICSTSAHSQRFGGPGGGKGRDGHRPIHPVERVLDTNRNGKLSSNEIALAGENLVRLDANEDGQLTGDEYDPALPGGERGFGAPRKREIRGGNFNPPPHPIALALDTNNDAILDHAELRQAAATLLELDANRDGSLAAEEIHPSGHPRRNPQPGGEMPELHRKFGQSRPHPAPKTQTAQVSNSEAVRRFMSLDVDKNGRISHEEIPDRLADLMRADANRDGYVTRPEATDFVEQLRPAKSADTTPRPRSF